VNARVPAGLTAELKLQVRVIAIAREFVVKFGADHFPSQSASDPTFEFLFEDPEVAVRD